MSLQTFYIMHRDTFGSFRGIRKISVSENDGEFTSRFNNLYIQIKEREGIAV